MKLYNCPRCNMAVPRDTMPPPGAVCYPCYVEGRQRPLTSLVLAFRALQRAHAELDPRFAQWPHEHDDAEE